MSSHRFLVPVAAMLVALSLLSHNAPAQIYTVSLSGPNESPTNNSPGTGVAQITIDIAAHTFSIVMSFTGLTAPATAAHIHAPTTIPGVGTAGVATQTPSFTGFPGATSGTYANTFNMTLASTWNPAYVTANGGSLAATEAAFIAAIQQGRAYLNIHTSTFPGGEIRGFLAVPEGGETATLMLVGLAGLALGAFRLRRC